MQPESSPYQTSHWRAHIVKHMAELLFQPSRMITINLLMQIAVTCNLDGDQKFEN